jgi:polyhydroxybutyrate depolymerase
MTKTISLQLALLACFMLHFQTGIAQQTVYDTITHNSVQRSYILYIPASYTPGTNVPLVFNFHGYTSDATSQMWYGDFRGIADTANFIIAHPMGTLDGSGITHFNVGWGGSSADDVGFTGAMIDSISASYSIDSDRVYSTGMSNGGFMSLTLACDLSSRFAAVASVTGSLAPFIMANCGASHPTPVLQIHGTTDGTVPYAGGAGWSESIDNLMAYWVNYNNCSATSILTNIPDSAPTDGSTVEHFLWEGGDNCVDVEHYKITGGGHTWAGSAFGSTGTNYDIDASEKVWQFFSRYDINGKIDCTVSVNEIDNELSLNVFPNPSNSLLQVDSKFQNEAYEIWTLEGKKVAIGKLTSSQLDIALLTQGTYILKVGERVTKFVKI